MGLNQLTVNVCNRKYEKNDFNKITNDVIQRCCQIRYCKFIQYKFKLTRYDCLPRLSNKLVVTFFLSHAICKFV